MICMVARKVCVMISNKMNTKLRASFSSMSLVPDQLLAAFFTLLMPLRLATLRSLQIDSLTCTSS
jgi:hypothetical protein